jgi:hypothetical protein
MGVTTENDIEFGSGRLYRRVAAEGPSRPKSTKFFEGRGSDDRGISIAPFREMWNQNPRALVKLLA